MSLPTLKLEIAFSTDPLAASPTWMDRTDDLRGGSIDRGRDRELGQPDAGVFRFTLDNQHRTYDPTHTGSAFYPNVLPLRKVRLSAVFSATTYYLFTGFIERWPLNWDDPNSSTVEVTAVDSFEFLSRYTLNGTYPSETTGARIGRVLDEIGWPAGDRSIATGQTTVPAATFAATDEKSALAHMQEVAESELGYLFANGQGYIVFHDRHTRLKSPYTTSQATFGDEEPEIPYEQLVPSYDKDEIVNEFRVTRSGGSTQTASDSTSQSRYGKRVGTRSPLLTSDTEAGYMASFLVSQYKNPALRFEGMRVKPLETDTVWTQVLARELGDRVTVKRRPPENPTGAGTVISQDCHIERVKHEFTSDRDWACYWDLSPADQLTYWTLGDAVNGLLGTTTVLAY